MVEQTHALIHVRTQRSFLSLDDLAIATALHPRTIEQFVSFGLLEPSVTRVLPPPAPFELRQPPMAEHPGRPLEP
jgi:hypothetical protein